MCWRRGLSKSPTKVLDFMTNADVAKAEQEGQLVFYCHENEAGTAGIMEGFSKDFPKIKTSYVRAQTGALYNKILVRALGRPLRRRRHPALRSRARLRFPEEGRLRALRLAGIAGLQEGLSQLAGRLFLLDRRRSCRHRLQHRQGRRPRTRRRAGRTSSIRAGRARSAARSPPPACSSCSGTRCASSTATASGRSSPSCSRTPSIPACSCSTASPRATTCITAIGEYPAYILFKSSGAKVEFVAPPDGLVATPLVVGAVNKAPHPEAAKLFVDWAMSKRGQAWYQTNPNLYYGSVRTDAPPMPTGVKLSDFKLLYPDRLGRVRQRSATFPEGMERHARPVSAAAAASAGLVLRAKTRRVWGRRDRRGRWSSTRSSICCRPRSTSATRRRGRRPPTASTISAACSHYPQILLNTLTVSFAATVMALVFGFVMAWILTRTNVPGRRIFEQLMAVPYYLTPLLGALAWSMLGAPESGFINQVWRALGGSGHLIDINTPYGIAWVMALFEGSVAFVMIAAVMKSMDPVARGGLAGDGREPAAHHAARHAAAGRCPACSARRSSCSPRCSARSPSRSCSACPTAIYVITTAIYQLVQQYPPKIPGRGGDGRVAVRGDVRHAVHLPAHRHGAAATSPSPARRSARASTDVGRLR